jgi:hypothetical protein
MTAPPKLDFGRCKCFIPQYLMEFLTPALKRISLAPTLIAGNASSTAVAMRPISLASRPVHGDREAHPPLLLLEGQ